MKFLSLIFFTFVLSSCQHQEGSQYGNNETNKNLLLQLDSIKEESIEDFPKPSANISELERELNNGGFHQYFYNSSGQNCLKTFEKLETYNDDYYGLMGELLGKAIEVINPQKLDDADFIDKIRNRKLQSLYNDSIYDVLDSLDNVYYGY